MVYNILNGDALAYSFPAAGINGDVVVFREALMDGDLSGDRLHEFWQSRCNYHQTTQSQYHDQVVTELEKILAAPNNSIFNLWFEYDLFCQVNLWFVISLINSLSITKTVYVVHTSYLDRNSKHFWNGFGPANSKELQICFADKILLGNTDLQLGQDLWTAYKSGNLAELIRLKDNQSAAFPYLQEIITAHVDRFPTNGTIGRPERIIEDIIKNVSTDFQKVFEEFWKRESIYGFGDSQLKELYDKVKRYS